MAFGGSSRHTMEPRAEDCEMIYLDTMDKIETNSQSLGGNKATNYLQSSKKMQQIVSSSEDNSKDYNSELQDQFEELPIKGSYGVGSLLQGSEIESLQTFDYSRASLANMSLDNKALKKQR